MAYIKTRPTTTLKIKVVNVKCTNLTDIPHNVPLANAVLTSHVYSLRIILNKTDSFITFRITAVKFQLNTCYVYLLVNELHY